MGYYVNPPGESKESFLRREGLRVPNDRKITWDSVPKGFLPVVLLDNGPFTAAGIAYCESELNVFTRLDDPRSRQVFMVKIDKLLPVSDHGLARYLKESDLL